MRITSIDIVADLILWPRLSPLMQKYPELRVEIETSYRMSEIVGERFDFGVRAGSGLDKDMIAARLTPDYRRVVVGAPAYFDRRAAPESPSDLASHRCIAMRLSSAGGLFPWKLKKGAREVQIKPDGGLVMDNSYQILNAALAGCGLAYTPDFLAESHVKSGRLRVVLKEWSPLSRGFFLYYPNRRQPTRAMSVVIDALRHRAGSGER